MATWENTVVTQLGLNLQAKLEAGTQLVLTKAVSSTHYANPDTLIRQTTLPNQKQTLILNDVLPQDDGKAILPVVLTNLGLTNSYTLQQIGVFAKDPDLGEILYFVAQAEQPDVIPAETELADFTITYRFNIIKANAGSISATIDPMALATKADISVINENMDKLDEVVGGHLGDKDRHTSADEKAKIEAELRSVNENKVTLGERTQIPSGSDLDTYKTIGGFCVDGDNISVTVVNSPFSNAYILDVGNPTGGPTSKYIAQTATNFYSRIVKSRLWVPEKNQWTEWTQQAITKTADLTLLNGFMQPNLHVNRVCRSGNLCTAHISVTNPAPITKSTIITVMPTWADVGGYSWGKRIVLEGDTYATVDTSSRNITINYLPANTSAFFSIEFIVSEGW